MTMSAIDITIFDGQSSGSTGWYSARENNETEPGTITSQVWDLETIQLDGNKLAITGGYDFRTGALSGGKWYRRGDILIDLNGDARTTWSGTAADKTLNSYFNYDFAIHFSTTANDLSYTIVDLNADSRFAQVTDVHKSNPWRLDDAFLDGAYIDGKSGMFDAAFTELASDAEGKHYSLAVDLANYQALLDAISDSSKMLVKYTIECGNDTILGEAALFQPAGETVPDSGATLALFAFAVGGVVFFQMRARLQPVRA